MNGFTPVLSAIVLTSRKTFLGFCLTDSGMMASGSWKIQPWPERSPTAPPFLTNRIKALVT